MRLFAWVWFAISVLLMAATAQRFMVAPPLETDLLALLPATERNPLAEEAATRLGRLSGERAVFLVGALRGADARDAATFLAHGLEGGAGIRQVITRVSLPDPALVLDLYRPGRLGLLAPEDRQAGPDPLAVRLDTRLASPFGVGALPLADDPFGLFDGWLQTLPYQRFRMTIEDGWLVTRGEGRTWVMVSAELAGSAFDPVAQDDLSRRLLGLEGEMGRRWPAIEVLRAGAVFHATAAREGAQAEMHLIGMASLAAIVLLLLFVYRSPGPLLAGLFSVAVGVACGAQATLALFGKIHLMTLVFGASLIGEAIDYAIQYFSARLGAGSDWDALHGRAQILPGLAIALATSVVGYAALTFTPFPAMRQIAVFAISGLCAAWLTVMILLPVWLASPQGGGMVAPVWPGRWLAAWRARMASRFGTFMLVMGLLLSSMGWVQLSVDDDVHQLIQPPPQLEAQEARLRTLTGLEAGSQFFLLEGETPESLLRLEEALASRLGPQGITLQGLAGFVPSCARQSENRQHLQQMGPILENILLDRGFTTSSVQIWRAELSQVPSCIQPEAWLSSPVSVPFRHLWLGQRGDRVAALVVPSGYASVDELARGASGLNGVTLVDKPGAVSRLFGEYRRLGSWVVAGATALIFAVLVWRYGLAGGLVVLMPTLLAQGAALGILGWLGVSLNLFNLLALLLVLGVGINYAIFLREGARQSGGRESAALLGVLLSAITTLLSFGLLGLSSMPALAGFGLTLGLGVTVAVLLAPMASTEGQP